MTTPTSQLSLYNDALLLMRERKIASLTENIEARRILDTAWDGGVVQYCLERGQWTFATRTIKLLYSPSVEPTFGYPRAFDKPDDFVRTAAICSDEFFREPLLQYSDEADFWFANIDIIYVKYVSNDDEYGWDMGKWPQSFVEFVVATLANRAVGKITQSKEVVDDVRRKFDGFVKEAKSVDAMAKPTAFPPMGTWTRSRLWGGRSFRDGGNPHDLIG